MLSNTVHCMWKYVFKCVCYYWKQQGDTDCIHYVCTVLSITEAQIPPWFLKAVLTNSFFKSHNNSNRPTVQETSLLLCTTCKWQLLLHIAYLWRIYKSCTSAQNLSHFSLVVAAKRSLQEDIFRKFFLFWEMVVFQLPLVTWQSCGMPVVGKGWLGLPHCNSHKLLVQI